MKEEADGHSRLLGVGDSLIDATGGITIKPGSTSDHLKLENLPSSDPGVANQLFVTSSAGANLGGITGSGFSLLCISNG